MNQQNWHKSMPTPPSCMMDGVFCTALGQAHAQGILALPNFAYYCVLAVQQGAVHAIWQEQGAFVQAGGAILLSATQEYTLTALAQGCQYRYVLVQGQMIAQMAQQMQDNAVFAQGGLCLQRSMGALFDMVAQGNTAPSTELCAQSYQLFTLLYGTEAQTEAYPQLVTETLHYMQQQLAYIYGVEDIAQAMQVSKEHLIRVFTATMGQSVGRYLTMLRIARAKQLLASESLPLETLATASGFSSASYFCKVFRAETGLTPREFEKTCPRSLAPAEIYL